MQDMNHIKNQLELSRNVHSFQGLDNLRQSAQKGEHSALQETAEQFEAIFIRMMLKSMRSAQDALADENSPFNSQQVKFYRDMHDQQLATNLASNGSLGLAEVIVRQLNPQGEGYLPASVLRNDADLSSLNRQRIQDTEQAANQVLGSVSEQQAKQAFKHAAFDSPQAFIAELLPKAKPFAQELGLEPEALVAQAALETGWGKHMIYQTDGQNSHNLFGIKADARWQGEKASIDTLEYQDGVAQKQKAQFRAYDSFEHALADYLSFVKDGARYEQAIQKSQHPQQYFDALQQAGYATDPNYAAKVMAVLDNIKQQFDAGEMD